MFHFKIIAIYPYAENIKLHTMPHAIRLHICIRGAGHIRHLSFIDSIQRITSVTTGLHLRKHHPVSFQRHYINFITIHAPVTGYNSITLTHQQLTGDILTPAANITMTRHIIY